MGSRRADSYLCRSHNRIVCSSCTMLCWQQNMRHAICRSTTVNMLWMFSIIDHAACWVVCLAEPQVQCRLALHYTASPFATGRSPQAKMEWAENPASIASCCNCSCAAALTVMRHLRYIKACLASIVEMALCGYVCRIAQTLTAMCLMNFCMSLSNVKST